VSRPPSILAGAALAVVLAACSAVAPALPPVDESLAAPLNPIPTTLSGYLSEGDL